MDVIARTMQCEQNTKEATTVENVLRVTYGVPIDAHSMPGELLLTSSSSCPAIHQLLASFIYV